MKEYLNLKYGEVESLTEEEITEIFLKEYADLSSALDRTIKIKVKTEKEKLIEKSLFDYHENNIPSHFINFSSGSSAKVIDFKELEEGCLTYLQGHKYPFRANVIGHKVAGVTKAKRLIPKLLFLEKNIFKKIAIGLFLAIQSKEIINWIDWQLSEVYLPVKKYNQPTREVFRVMSDKGIDSFRNVVCAILEFDLAYRYRFQDIIGQIDKSAFQVNPLKEIKRLARIMFERELTFTGMGRFRSYFSLICAYLFLNRKLLKKLKMIVKDLKVEEIKSSVEDKYWQCEYQDYNFMGLSFEERRLLREIL